ncbi:DNA excision repair protein ERCC-8-like [Bacillus rossius redtenbacheri]|uniref:DNA excision repair protein ERCC-8-like n=1 Tax=Bacillus rossius redtenbacheri TaxID=93214 RepID=UPI002FDD9735
MDHKQRSYNILNVLEKVRAGVLDARAVITCESLSRSRNLKLSKLKDFENVLQSATNQMDVDCAEGKYLLCGLGDGSICIYNLYNYTGSPQFTCNVECMVDKNNRHAHKFSTECVQWYPFDTGMFLSSGMDKKLKVWDTNTLIPVESFSTEGKVYQHHMARNSLIAVASSANQISLIDIRKGSSVHELRGHSSLVLTCRWSPTEEYLLASGSCDRKVLLWDVRSARSCLRCLDQHNGEGQSNSQSTSTAHDGFVNGLCFSENGLYLLSYGTDDSLRLWDVCWGRNEMVSFGSVPNHSKKCVQLDVRTVVGSGVAYVPSGSNVLLFNIESGRNVRTLHGHFSTVNGCRFHPFLQELYSCGNDRNILVWSAGDSQVNSEQDEDAWSGDEN